MSETYVFSSLPPEGKKEKESFNQNAGWRVA
jgi:hypothetical protein